MLLFILWPITIPLIICYAIGILFSLKTQHYYSAIFLILLPLSVYIAYDAYRIYNLIPPQFDVEYPPISFAEDLGFNDGCVFGLFRLSNENSIAISKNPSGFFKNKAYRRWSSDKSDNYGEWHELKTSRESENMINWNICSDINYEIRKNIAEAIKKNEVFYTKAEGGNELLFVIPSLKYMIYSYSN